MLGYFDMSQLEKKLVEMLSPAVEALGFELWGIEFIRAGKHSTLRLYIDSENGVSVDQCADVSRQVGAVLDVEDPITKEYNLEVSSPGMDRLLFKADQYQRYIGSEISLRLNMPVANRRNFKAVLNAVENDNITVDADGESFELALSNVSRANVIPNFE